MKKTTLLTCAITLFTGLNSFTPSSWAADQIIRPYQSVRNAGMGGVRITTGFYDENFFGNPARVTANPTWRVGLPDPLIEFGAGTFDTFGDLTEGDDTLSQVGNTAGNNNHGRIQMTFPSFYIPKGEGRWAFAFSIITSLQFDMNLHRNFQLDPQAIIDVGPAFTVGRTFLEDQKLSVGVTPHVTYRLASEANYGLDDLIRGASLSPLGSGGDGAHVDFDIGATYDLPWHYKEFDFTTGASINNMLGGKYKNIPVSLADLGTAPPEQPRALNVGVSAKRKSWGKLDDVVFALDVSDIGNNTDGSIFRLLHMGSEVRWRRLQARLGFNQGYWTAGFGADLKILQIDLATYGEEMSLNTGGAEDRRYALRLGFQI